MKNSLSRRGIRKAKKRDKKGRQQKIMRRGTSLFIVIMLAFSLINVGVFAQGADFSADIRVAEAPQDLPAPPAEQPEPPPVGETPEPPEAPSEQPDVPSEPPEVPEQPVPPSEQPELPPGETTPQPPGETTPQPPGETAPGQPEIPPAQPDLPAEQPEAPVLLSVSFYDEAGGLLSAVNVNKNEAMAVDVIPAVASENFLGWFDKTVAESIAAARAQYLVDLQTYEDAIAAGQQAQAPQMADISSFGAAVDLTLPVADNLLLQAVYAWQPPAATPPNTEQWVMFNQETQTITGYSSSTLAPKDVVIPSTINGVAVLHIGDNAFAGQQLTSVAIPEGVLTIGNYAFYNNPSITTLDIPNSVTSIGAYAFSGCNSLTSIKIPDGVTSIGNSTFNGCSSLTSINIPDGVTGIGNNAFYGCSSLTSITLPDGVTGIGNSAFEGCSNLTSITLPDGVTGIGYQAFYGCSSLTSVTIPEGVTSIGAYTFNGCSSLGSVTVPDSVTYIGSYAFASCSSLTSITIPGNVTYIDDRAFSGCSSLKKIYIPTKETDSISGAPWGSKATVCWKDLIDADPFVFNKKTRQIVKYIGSGGAVDIPETFHVDGQDIPVEGIEEKVFKENAAITSINIPSSVTAIGYEAFRDCNNLTSVTLSEGLTNIGNSAFYGCSNLTSITIPDSVTSIGDYAFYICSSLKKILIPTKEENSISGAPWGSSARVYWKGVIDANPFVFNTRTKQIVGYTGLGGDVTIPEKFEVDGQPIPVEGIGEEAFRFCSSLTSVTLPDSITSISYNAFLRCSNLQKIYIPTKETDSISGARWGAETITSVIWKDTPVYDDFIFDSETRQIVKYIGSGSDVVIPEAFTVNGQAIPVEGIGDSAFANGLITSVTIPDGVTSIGKSAFENCNKLTSINIPDGVTRIGNNAFKYCSKLTSINIPEGVTGIGRYAFYSCESLASVTLPDSLITIGERAFSDCGSLTSINIPEGVTSIGESAFSSCSSLISVTLPDSLITIDDYAFYGCSSLTSITIPEGVNSIGRNAFGNCSSLTSINIPEGVTSIGESAFSYCSSLTSITIPDSVTSIGSYSFNGCNNLKKIYIPTKETDAISGAPWWSNATVYWKGVVDADPFVFDAKNRQILKYIGSGGAVNIPEKITVSGQNIPVESIGYGVFQGNTAITSINIPSSVTAIDSWAFYGCTGLTSINIPSSVTAIDYRAFNGCTSLASVTLAEGVTTIGGNAFDGCSSLTSINIPSSLTTIDSWAFNGCTSLTSINIPSSLTTIGYEAFNDCTSLTSINIPSGVTTISVSAFKGCTSLASVTLAEGVTTIGYKAFEGCKSLISINIPSSVTSIDSYAFNGCTSLASVTLAEGLTKIGDYAFYGCEGLSSTSITIPKSVTSIGNNTFSGCGPLTSILMEMPRASASIDVTRGQPWGAPKDTPVKYKGDYVAFRHTVEEVPGEYKQKIILTAYLAVPNKANKITLPDGTSVKVGDRSEYTTTYEATNNGIYTFKGTEDTNFETTYDVNITGIGVVALTANNCSVFVSEAPNITKEKVIELTGASAKDELNAKVAPLIISDADLAKVQALSKNAESVTITVTAGPHSVSGETASKDVVITAKAQHTVTFTTDNNGSLNNNTPQTVDYGTAFDDVTKPVTTPNEGYVFDKWTLEDGSAVPATITGDITVKAHFKLTQHTVKFTDDGNGSLNNNTTQTVDYGKAFDDVTKPVTTPNEGYVFDKWTLEDGSAVPATITGDITVRANFKLTQHTVKFTDDGNGSLNNNISQTVDYGTAFDDVTKPVTTPNEGYVFDKWTLEDGSAVPATITGDITVKANFKATPIPTPSATPTPTPSVTPTPTPSVTPTPTPSATPTPTPSVTPTPTPSVTPTPPPSATPTPPPSVTPTPTPSATPTPTPSVTPIPTPSATPTPTPSVTPPTTPSTSPAPTDTVVPIIPEQEDPNPPTDNADMPANPDEATMGAAGVVQGSDNDPPAPPPGTTEYFEVENGKTLENLKDEGRPTVQLGDMEIPLSGMGFQGVWGLMNLILLIAGLGLSAKHITTYIRRKKRGSVEATAEMDIATRKQQKLRALFSIFGFAAGVAGLILFILTQDMRTLMVLVDSYTPVMAALVIFASLMAFLPLKKGKYAKKADSTQQEIPAQEAEPTV